MFDISDSVPIAWDVKDASGNLVNASTATLTITLPDGTSATPAVTNPPASTGQYRVTYIPTLPGRYSWTAVTTVPNTAYSDVFDVRDIPSSLVSLADVKAHLNMTSTANDEALREYMEAATEIIESYIGPVVRRSHTERIRGYNNYIIGTGYNRAYGYRTHISLPHTNVLAVTAISMVLDGSQPFNLADIAIDTDAGIISSKTGVPFPYWDMDITYTVGKPYVKANWVLAAKIIVKHNWETQLGNLPSIQGDDPGFISTGAGYLVPFRALALLGPDQVPAGFA